MKTVQLTASQSQYIESCVGRCAPFLFQKEESKMYRSILKALREAS